MCLFIFKIYFTNHINLSINKYKKKVFPKFKIIFSNSQKNPLAPSNFFDFVKNLDTSMLRRLE